MPPNPPLRVVARRTTSKIFTKEPYVCPNCTYRRFSSSPSSNGHPATRRHKSTTSRVLPTLHGSKRPNSLLVSSIASKRHDRNASTSVASVTAVNAPIDIPPAFAELHAALDKLRHDASSYVNLSRAELARKGLEGPDGIIRVAVLSTGDPQHARVLARLLCADPLAEVEEWEGRVEQAQDGSLLLRYGAEDLPSPGNRLLHTISAPARLLRTNKIEILIASLNTYIATPVQDDTVESAQDAILVPTLETPTSASGRYTHISYPVHKAIVLGDGAASMVDIGGFISRASQNPGLSDMVKFVVTLPAPTQDVKQQASDKVIAADLDLAQASLDSFRKSIANAIVYEKGWFKSGLPAISDWVTQGTISDATVSGSKPAIIQLTNSLLDDAERRIDQEAKQTVPTASSSSSAKRTALSDSIGAWAEQAHTELQNQLDLAFTSKHWRKLSWWKLFWRVDDVSMVAEDIVERRWLVEAEKQLIFVAGRMNEAGLWRPTSAGRRPRNPPQVEQTAGWTLQEPPAPSYEDLIPIAELQKKDDDGSMLPPGRKPWPMAIPSTRYLLTNQSIPALQATAQKLVLQSYSTSALTLAVSASAYLGLSTTSIYEAGAVAALGLIFSLRRLQGAWEKERARWMGEVREDGRVVLKETEEAVRGLVVEEQAGSRVETIAEGERRKARDAVGRVRLALEKLQNK